MKKLLKSIEENEIYNDMLKEVGNWCNHRPLLCVALELTKNSKSPILELGCGGGSTVQLSNYIKTDNRELVSFDTNESWLNKYSYLKSDKHKFVYKLDDLAYSQESREWYNRTNEIPNWLKEVTKNGISVCLVDHACGERRHIDILEIYDKCETMVIHDSEPAATGYMLDKIWHLFKYRINYKTSGAWTTMVSNTYNISQLDGLELKDFKFEI